MSLDIAVPIITTKRLQNQQGDVLELAAGTTLHGVFSAQAWPGPFGIEYDHPSYMQVTFHCTGPDRPFVYRGVLSPYDHLFCAGEETSSSQPDEPQPIEIIGPIDELFDHRADLLPVIDGEIVKVRSKYMTTYFKIHLCPLNVLVHCRFYDAQNCANFREVWYPRSYESYLFTNAPRCVFGQDGNLEEYFTREADYVDFELL